MEEKHFFSLYSLSFWVTGGFAVFQILNISLGIEDHFIRQLINSRLPRVNAFNHEPSFYVLYMSLFVMYLAARYLLSGERFKMVVFGFILLALSFTTSSVFATLLFIILGFVYAKRQKVLKRWLWLSSSLLFLWGIAIVLFWKPFQLFVFKMGGENPLESHSIAFRWEGIIKSLRLFFEYPFFGVGYGGVVPHLYKEAYLWERGNEMPLNYDLGEIPPFEPTNVLTEVAASFGLFGIFGFLMLVYSFWQTYRECVQIQQLEHGERVRLKALAFSLLMGILLLQVNQSLFRSYIWVHAAITYGYFCKVKKKYVLISNQQA